MPSRGAPRRTPETGRREIFGAAVFVVIAALAALALFLIHPVASGFRLPVGPDGPVYTWLARYASVAGFGDVPGAGPGVSALALTLGAPLQTVPVETVFLLGPVLAACCGLAGGAVVEAALGPNTGRTAAAVAMTAAFAAYLAGGWLANLVLVGLFLAVATALSLAATSWRPVILGAGLLTAAGLSHRIFVVAAVGIVLASAALGIREVRSAIRAGRKAADAPPVREAIAAGAGGAIAGLALLWVGTGPMLEADTSQDGFLRRTGLRSLLLDRYRERFLGDLTRSAVPLAAGLLLGGTWFARGAGSTDGERFLRRFVVAWAAVTVAGVAALVITGTGPANRVLQFAFFLPLAAACGVGVLIARRAPWSWLAGVAVVGFVAAALFGWSRQSPAFEPGELAAGGRASAAARTTGIDSPMVFLVDTDEPAAAYHVTRMANVIRAGVDAGDIDDVHIAVGAPADYLAGRPTLTGGEEHDAISTDYAAEVDPIRDRALVLLLPEFSPDGYAEAKREGVEVLPGVVVLRAGAGSSIAGIDPGGGVPAATTTGSEGLDTVELLILSPAAILLLGIAGGGWSSWALRRAGGRAILLAAPSVGAAVAIVGAVAAEALGFLPGSVGSVVAVLALAGLGYSLALPDRS